MSAPVRVIALVAAYNEEDVIEEVVRALIEDGVDVYFLDNHSTDETVARVTPYVGRGVIGIERFPAKPVAEGTPHVFVWEQILRRKERLAQDLDADWFIHSDADEFRESPWAGETLRDGISRVDAAGYNAIDFQVLNFKPTTADDSSRTSIRTRVEHYEPGEVFDHLQIKCWKKTGARVDLATTGGHSAEFGGRNVFPIRFILRHYPIRSQAHGERKVFQERQRQFSVEERAKGWHVQYDGFTEGVSFVQEPALLTRYDPTAVRLDLIRHHREVERLESALAASQDEAGRLRDEVHSRCQEIADLRAHEQRLAGEVHLQGEELHRRDQEIQRRASELLHRDHEIQRRDEELHRHTEEVHRHTEEIHRHREELHRRLEEIKRREGEIAELQAHVNRLAGDVSARKATIQQLMTSRSWKLTEPLRAVDQFFRGPRPDVKR